jgi:hypothetical protein
VDRGTAGFVRRRLGSATYRTAGGVFVGGTSRHHTRALFGPELPGIRLSPGKTEDPRKRRVEASKESPLALTVQQNNPKYDQQYDRDQ